MGTGFYYGVKPQKIRIISYFNYCDKMSNCLILYGDIRFNCYKYDIIFDTTCLSCNEADSRLKSWGKYPYRKAFKTKL